MLMLPVMRGPFTLGFSSLVIIGSTVMGGVALTLLAAEFVPSDPDRRAPGAASPRRPSAIRRGLESSTNGVLDKLGAFRSRP
ncbi:MAG TPA: hypothetical protein VM429_11200 [Micropruina sp.]|nr:hypothetical protein [Micropruina sp.]